jgi:acyl-CoA thioester hydrolase
MVGYTVRVQIRFSDLDVFGHVNHARYLTYCEDHRTVMFAQLGRDTGSWLLKTGIAVARIECSYLQPIRLDDEDVSIMCTVEALGTSSMRLYYELQTRDQLAAWVRTTLVLTAAGGARPITDSERTWMSRYLS